MNSYLLLTDTPGRRRPEYAGELHRVSSRCHAAAGEGPRGAPVDQWMPCLVQRRLGESGVEVRLGHELLDDYLRFVGARCRPNSVLAAGFNLKVFFAFVGKEPAAVTTADVLDFIAEQRAPRHGDNVCLLYTSDAADEEDS